MFEYLDPDADGASNLPPAPGDGSLPVPPNTGSPGKGIRPLRPERVRHLLYGSRAAIERTIKILHAQGYADPNDWSDPIPVPPTSDTLGATSPAGAVWMAFAKRSVPESPPKPC